MCGLMASSVFRVYRVDHDISFVFLFFKSHVYGRMTALFKICKIENKMIIGVLKMDRMQILNKGSRTFQRRVIIIIMIIKGLMMI